MKHTIKGFITYEKSKYSKNARIDFTSYRPTSDIWPNMVIVSEHSIEVEVPDNFDPRPDLIASLKEKEQKARANFKALVTDIRRQIIQYEALSMDEKS